MADEKHVQIFNAAREAGLGKDQIIMKLAMEGGVSVTMAVRAYQELAKNAGVTMSAQDRNAEITAMLDATDPESLKEVDVRRGLIIEIADKFDVSEATAAASIRKYCEDTGIELPTVQRTSLEDMVKFVNELHEAGNDSKAIKARLEEEMGYTANTAASAYSRAMRELGLSTGRTGASVPLHETVAFMRARSGLGRKEMVKEMGDHLGYAPTTAAAFYTYVNFAKEWAKQELEAKTKA